MKNQSNTINHLWTIPCKNSSVDQKTNLLSLFEIQEEFSVDLKIKKDFEVLNIPVTFQIITMWEKKNKNEIANADIEIEYFDPNNKKLGIFKYKLSIPEDKKRFRNIVSINGIGITVPGEYFFKVKKQEHNMKESQLVGQFSINMKINKEIVSDKN